MIYESSFCQIVWFGFLVHYLRKLGVNMVQVNDCHCLEIMECDNPQNCLAWKHPERPCWEIIKELNDHRKVFNICQDCIVRILKLENSVLSEIEILKISETKL